MNHPATRHARRVLADCEEAVREFSAAKHETVRRRWVTALALLRAIGHVLEKKDGLSPPVAKSVIAARWTRLKATKPEPVIFRRFIDDERNLILKTYTFGVSPAIIVSPGPFGERHRAASQKGTFAVEGGARQASWRLGVSPLITGPFEGREPIDVLRQALAFWNQYLGDVDRACTEATAKAEALKRVDE